jgi:hypothetical protein
MTLPIPKNQTTLEVHADLLPLYANLVRIAHSPADLVLDFAHLLPGETRAKVSARILMSPLSAKLLYRALGENLARYEASFGEINMPATSLADQLFKPAPPPENPAPPDEGKS